MAEKYRIKCPFCGNVANLVGTNQCPKCHAAFDLGREGMLHLYRQGNFLGLAYT